MAGKSEKAIQAEQPRQLRLTEQAGQTGQTGQTGQKFDKEAFSEFTLLQRLESELREFGAIGDFPDDGIERYDSLTDRMYSVREKIAQLKHRITSELELAAQINKNPASEILKKNKDITYLEKRIAGIGEHETKLKILDKEIEQKSAKLRDEISKIFPYWTGAPDVPDTPEILEGKLAALDFSFSVVEQFNNYLDEIAEVERQQAELRKRIDREQISKKDAEDRIRDIRQQILDITSNESADTMRSDIIKIREALLYKESIACEIRSLAQYRKELLLELCEAEGFSSPVADLRIMFFSQLAFSLCCAVIILFWHIFNAGMLPYTLLAFAVIFSFAVFSAFIYHRGLKNERDQMNVLSMFIDKKEDAVDSIGDKIADLESQEDEVTQDIEDLSSKLDIPSVDSSNIEELSEQLESARLKLRRYADVKEQERQLSGSIEKFNANLALYRQDYGRLSSRAEQSLSLWRGWLVKNNYPEHVTIGEFETFVSCAKDAQGKLEVLSTLRREAQSERKFIQSTDELLRDFCSSMNIKNEDIQDIFNSIKESASLKKRMDEVNDNVVRLNSEKKAAEEILEKYAAEVQELFAEANVSSEKEFRELADAWEQRWIINARAEEVWHKLSVICGGRKAAEKYVEEKRAGVY